MMRLASILLLLLVLASTALADIELEDYNSYKQYRVRLKGGDVLTGYITLKSSDERGEYIELEMLLGKPKIYLSEIIEISSEDNFDRQSHRVFLMPTADGIDNNHYIGSFEALMVVAGFGISEYGSITLGRSIVPFIRSDEQISLLNAKASVYDMMWEDGMGGMSIGVGGNLLFLNNKNRFIHGFTNITFFNPRSSITIMIFNKLGSQDLYTMRLDKEEINFALPDGAFGVGLGITSRFSDRHGLYFLGELWTPDVQKPLSSGVMLGFRVANTEVAADFGLSFFAEPLVMPFFSFVWTPFN